MRQQLDIYWKNRPTYEKELKTLKEWPISQTNKEIILQWHNNLFASGSGVDRVMKLSSQFRKIVLHLDKDIDSVSKQDIELLVAKFNREIRWREPTKADYRRCIKQFFGWYKEQDLRMQKGEDVAKQLYSFIHSIKVAYPEERIDYSEIITEEDLAIVISKGAICAKEKALLSVLHEGGFRVGELLNMQIRDLDFKPDRVIVSVDGKTGKRRVPLVQSIGLLSRWLEEHPFKDSQNSYLWTGNNSKFMHQPLKHIGTQKLVRRTFKKANIAKRCNLHWFRHSRATLLAPHLSEVMMCKYLGWHLGSDMVRRYVHADVSQVEDAILVMRGLQRSEQPTSKVQTCLNCKMINESGARYCHLCGRPMSVGIALADEEKKSLAIDEAFSMLQVIMSDPEMKKKYDSFKQC